MNVSTASTAELVALYNEVAAELAKQPVNRFSDRKTAERRVAAIIAERDAANAMALGTTEAPKAEAPKAEAAKYVVGTCPNCGATEDITCGTVIERHGKQEVVREHEAHCHGCGHEFNYDNGKPLKAKKPSVDRSAAIAATWTNAEVRAARAMRHAVTVIGRGNFDSVAKAFAALNLPSNKIIRTRAALVRGERVVIEGHEFVGQN